MRAEFEAALAESENTRTAVHGALAGSSDFCALRKACRKLREGMQVAKNRHLELYARKLEELAKAGDMRG